MKLDRHIVTRFRCAVEVFTELRRGKKLSSTCYARARVTRNSVQMWPAIFCLAFSARVLPLNIPRVFVESNDTPAKARTMSNVQYNIQMEGSTSRTRAGSWRSWTFIVCCLFVRVGVFDFSVSGDHIEYTKHPLYCSNPCNKKIFEHFPFILHGRTFWQGVHSSRKAIFWTKQIIATIYSKLAWTLTWLSTPRIFILSALWHPHLLSEGLAFNFAQKSELFGEK